MELHDLATKQLTNLFLYGSLLLASTHNRIEHNNIGLGPAREGEGAVLVPNDGRGVVFSQFSDFNIIKNTKFAQGTQWAIEDMGINKVLDPNSILGEGYAIYRGTLEGVPVLTSAAVSGTKITIAGTLTHNAKSTYKLEFFGNTVANRQAEQFLGDTTVTTDENGVAAINVPLEAVFGSYVTATSTGIADDGFTSEVSVDIPITGLSNLAAVGDRVWDDMNGNGLQDPGEPGLADAVVRLTRVGGGYSAQTSTDTTGRYFFTNVPPGDYSLQFFPPADYRFSRPYQGDSIFDSDAAPLDGTTAVFTLLVGQVDPTFDAGMVKAVGTVVAGPGPGRPPLVKLLDAESGLERFSFLAYEETFSGGVRVAMADVTGDGIPDIVTAPGAGRAAEVKVFDGLGGSLVRSHDPFAGFTGGAYVAAGDLDLDGFAEVLVGSGAGLENAVFLYTGSNGAEVALGAPYEAGFTGGVRLALGDVTGDGTPDLLTAPGPGRWAEVRVFSGSDGAYVRSHFYFDFTGGAFVAAGDRDLDGHAEVLIGPDAGYAPVVVVFNGSDGQLLGAAFAYDPAFSGGVRVGFGDVNGDGVPDYLTAPGAGIGPEVKAFSGVDGALLNNFLAFEPGFTGGVFVAGVSDPVGGGDGNGALQAAGTGGGEAVRVFSRLRPPAVAPSPPLLSPFLFDTLTLADLAQAYRLDPRSPFRWRRR